MAYIAMWAAFGGFILLISLINLFEFVKWIWFKRLGPTIYYLITGDADSLPRR